MSEAQGGGLASGGVPGDASGRLAFRVGPHRFEAEGPVAWVESMVGQWAQLLAMQAKLEADEPEAAPPSAPAEGVGTPPVPSQPPEPPAGDLGGGPPEAEAQAEDDGGFRRVSAAFRPKVNLDLSAFLKLKRAQSPQDLVLATAYYHERYLGLERYTPGQLNEALGRVPEWDCSDAAEQLELAALRGWVQPLDEGRWTLTYQGQDHVHHDMAYEHEQD